MILPGPREEVEVVALVASPHKANAGGIVERHQGVNDDSALFCGCRNKKNVVSVMIHVFKDHTQRDPINSKFHFFSSDGNKQAAVELMSCTGV